MEAVSSYISVGGNGSCENCIQMMDHWICNLWLYLYTNGTKRLV